MSSSSRFVSQVRRVLFPPNPIENSEKRKVKRAGPQHVSVLKERTSNPSDRPRPRHSRRFKNMRTASVLEFAAQEQSKHVAGTKNAKSKTQSNRTHTEPSSMLANIGKENIASKPQQSVLMDVGSAIDAAEVRHANALDIKSSDDQPHFRKRKATVLESFEDGPGRKPEKVSILGTLGMDANHNRARRKVDNNSVGVLRSLQGRRKVDVNSVGALRSLQATTSLHQSRKRQENGGRRRRTHKTSKRTLDSDLLSSSIPGADGKNISSTEGTAAKQTEFAPQSPQQKKTRRRKTQREQQIQVPINESRRAKLRALDRAASELQYDSKDQSNEPFRSRKPPKKVLSTLEVLHGGKSSKDETDRSRQMSMNPRSTLLSAETANAEFTSYLHPEAKKEVAPLCNTIDPTLEEDRTAVDHADYAQNNNASNIMEPRLGTACFVPEATREKWSPIQFHGACFRDISSCRTGQTSADESPSSTEAIERLAEKNCIWNYSASPKKASLFIATGSTDSVESRTSIGSLVYDIEEKEPSRTGVKKKPDAVDSKERPSSRKTPDLSTSSIANRSTEAPPAVRFIGRGPDRQSMIHDDIEMQIICVGHAGAQSPEVSKNRGAMMSSALEVPLDEHLHVKLHQSTVQEAPRTMSKRLKDSNAKEKQIFTGGSDACINYVVRPEKDMERPVETTETNTQGCRVLSVELPSPILGTFSNIAPKKVSTDRPSPALRPRRSSRRHVPTNRLTVEWTKSTKARTSNKQEAKTKKDQKKKQQKKSSRPCGKEAETTMPEENDKSGDHRLARVSSSAARAVRGEEKLNAKQNSKLNELRQPDDCLKLKTSVDTSLECHENINELRAPEPDIQKVSNQELEQSTGSSLTLSPVKELAGILGDTEEVKSSWTEEQVQSLTAARDHVDPSSSTFWNDFAERIEGKSAAECREKWFSLVKTPLVRRKKTLKKAKGIKQHASPDRDDDDDDIFNSTPMRGGFQLATEHCDSHRKDGHECCNDVVCDVGSPIVGHSREVNPSNAEYDVLRTEPVIQEIGYKKFLQGLKKGVEKAKREKTTSRAGMPTLNRILSEKEDEGEVALNARLSPGGTLRLNQLTDLDDDLIAFATGSDDEYSVSG